MSDLVDTAQHASSRAQPMVLVVLQPGSDGQAVVGLQAENIPHVPGQIWQGIEGILYAGIRAAIGQALGQAGQEVPRILSPHGFVVPPSGQH